MKSSHPDGVVFDIEPAGIRAVEDLIHMCQENGIQLIFVYSPEYIEMQSLTKNRPAIFAEFRKLSNRFNIPMWDYSDWNHCGDKEFFQNSQHLNTRGAEVFGPCGKTVKRFFG